MQLRLLISQTTVFWNKAVILGSRLNGGLG